MDYQQLITMIDNNVNQNGSGQITGMKLNVVLKAIVETMMENADAVHVQISSVTPIANFIWPFEDTAIEDLSFDGYNGLEYDESAKFPLQGFRILSRTSQNIASTTYNGTIWRGMLHTLERGKVYCIEYNDVSDFCASSIYIKRRNSVIV